MVVLLQVAAEYSVLASRNTPKGSLSDQLERISQAVPTEYVGLTLGGLVMVYLVKKVLDAL